MTGMHATTDWWVWMLTLACLIGFWLAAWLLVRSITRDHAGRDVEDGSPTLHPDPARLLDERLARGEIERDDYLDCRALIANSSRTRADQCT